MYTYIYIYTIIHILKRSAPCRQLPSYFVGRGGRDGRSAKWVSLCESEWEWELEPSRSAFLEPSWAVPRGVPGGPGRGLGRSWEVLGELL